jgi:hypothetical protein
MQEFRPIIDAFLTKIEEAPKVLPPAIAEGRAQEEQEQQYNKEAARKLRGGLRVERHTLHGGVHVWLLT